MRTVDEMIAWRDEVMDFIRRVLVEGRDYGHVEGIPKPILMKPGAEQLLAWHELRPTFPSDRQTVWRDDDGHISCLVTCVLLREDGSVAAEGQGMGSSRERMWEKRLARTGNIADIHNNVIKHAQKRALVAATLLATATSAFFTQDLDDEAPSSREEKARRVPSSTSQATSPSPPSSSPSRSSWQDLRRRWQEYHIEEDMMEYLRQATKLLHSTHSLRDISEEARDDLLRRAYVATEELVALGVIDEPWNKTRESYTQAWAKALDGLHLPGPDWQVHPSETDRPRRAKANAA